MSMVPSRWRGCIVGLCLFVSAGCSPVKRLSGEGNHQPPLPTPPSEKLVTDKPVSKPSVVTPVNESIVGYRISEDDPLVAERVLFYEKTLNAWREAANQLASRGEMKEGTDSWRDCLLAAEQALSGYHFLQAGQNKDINPWSIVARDVSYYQKGCDQVLVALQTKGAALQGQSSLLLPESDGLRAQLRQQYDSGDYLTVIATYEAVTRSQEQVQVSPEAKTVYGKALVKSGRFEDAAKIYTEVLTELGQGNDMRSLEFRLETGDVLLAAGRFDDARQVYQGQLQLLAPIVSQRDWAEGHAQAFAEQVPAEDLERYRALMQAYLKFDGKQVPSSMTEGVADLEQGKPGPLLNLARVMLAKARAQAQAWARGQLVEIRSLIDVQKLDQARVLLDELAAVAPPEMIGTIAQLQSEVASGQVLEPAVPEGAVVPESADPWQEAMVLFEHQKYDEAIASFQKLAGTNRAAEAQAKIAEASELAASAMRRQAATLFAKARNTFDPEIKRQTLESSRALLEQLIEKYPQTSIVEKARQNAQVINAELGASSSAPPPLH